MSVEDRLRDALHAEAGDVSPTDERWSTIESKVTAARRTQRVRRGGFTVLAIAATVAVVFGLVQVLGRDDARPQTLHVIDRGTTNSTPSITRSAASPQTTTRPAQPPAFWDRSFSDPRTAAVTFAREYIGMPDPVGGPYVNSVVAIRPKPGRASVSNVTVERRSDGRYVVQWVRADNLVIQSPADLPIASPVAVRGVSTAFEATFSIQIRQLGQLAGQSLGEQVVTGGGGSGTLEPFDASVSFTRPSATRGAVILFTRSAEDGSIAEASVQPLTFR